MNHDHAIRHGRIAYPNAAQDDYDNDNDSWSQLQPDADRERPIPVDYWTRQAQVADYD